MGETKRFSINGQGCWSPREVVEITGLSFAKIHEITTLTEVINGYAIKLIQKRLYFAYEDGKEIAGGCTTAENLARAIGYSVNGMKYQWKLAKKPHITIERKWVNV